MLYEFGGEPVAGGTLPALIWKEFVSSLEESDDNDSFEAPPYLGAVPTWVVKRGGTWQLDNGYCRGSQLLVYFADHGPEDEADCKPNEVAVPLVVGMTADTAVARLADQPLGTSIAYVPAKAGRLPGVVVKQDPREGGLSANDEVQLWVSKARYGLLPNFVGSSLEDVGQASQRLKLRYEVSTAPGSVGMVLEQSPRAGLAAAPRLRVRLVVGDGSRTVNG
jgi:hypothetical protein